MGRASRRKRERARAWPSGTAVGSGRPETRGTRTRLHFLALAGLVAAVIALGLGLWLTRAGDETPTRTSVELPDPDTSDMTAPVERAIRNARLAAHAQPASAAAVGQFGQVLHAHWLYEGATECYEIAHELAPEDFRWVYLLAGVEDIRGSDASRIDELFREAIRLAPQFPPVHVRHADALMRLGRWAEARDAYAEAARLDPELVLAYRGLGQAANLLGHGPEAVEHLERSRELAPEDRITQIALARAYALAGQDERAAEASRKAQTLTSQASLPDQVFFEVQNMAVDPESLRKRAARKLREGNIDAAIEALSLLEESEGAGGRLQLAAGMKRRANQLAFSGDFDAALPEFERAARLAPEDPEIEHNWGTVQLRRGDLEEAENHFERAIKIDPESADSLYNLGVVLERLGRSDEAIARFSSAAAIDPQHVAAKRLTELGIVPDGQN